MDNVCKKVAIVEGDTHIAKICEIKFEREGINVVVVKDGEDVIEVILQEKPHLIVLDIVIPKHDGFVMIQEIRQNMELADVPIIVLSNLGQKPDQDRALELGANEYIIMVSCSIQEVVDKVKEYLAP